MPIDIQALPLSSISTKWKEPYASASLNRRFVGITPQGIYRGLTLTEDPLSGDRTVIISQDTDNNDHVAVFQNENEYQVSYRDSASGDITLTLTAYASVDVLVTLFIDYQIGLATYGTYRIYTQAEFDGLAASLKDTLIVLGTVTIPGSGAIASSSISLVSRTLASANIHPGTIPRTPITRNPNFEIGEVAQSYRLSSQFWEKTVSVGSGTWKTSSNRADSGTKSIELAISVAPFTGIIKQQAGIEVIASQLITSTVSVWQDTTVSSGTFVMFMEFSDSTGTLLSTSSQSLGAGIDAGWREVVSVFTVPVGASTIRAFGVQCIALDPGSIGIFGYIDSLRMIVEPRVSDEAHIFDQRFRQRESVSGLRISDTAGNFSDLSADISFNKDSPVGEGKVSLLPANPSDEPPAFELAGRMIELGSQLLATAANALKARVSAEQADVGVSTYTLMWETKVAGIAGSRTYIKHDGTLINTGNAYWDGASWNKDVGGDRASMVEFGTDGSFTMLAQATGTDLWNDGAWTSTRATMNSIGEMSLGGSVELGVELRVVAADSGVPRIVASPSPVAAFTLISEFIGDLGPGHRQYMDDNGGSLFFISNARWNEATATWIKDINTLDARYEKFGPDVHTVSSRPASAGPNDATTGFSDGLWTPLYLDTSAISASSFYDRKLQWVTVGAGSQPAFVGGSGSSRVNVLDALSFPKVLCCVRTDGVGGIDSAFSEGYNWRENNVDITGAKIRIYFPAGGEMDDDDYIVTATPGGGAQGVSINDKNTAYIEFVLWDSSHVAINGLVTVMEVNFSIYGRQS